MKLYELFEKDISRDIEQVVKADDIRHLRDEITEYVMTNEIQKQLDNLLEEYLHPGSVNGSWISGFFGSGKSHLLKMLSLLLAHEKVDDLDIIDEFVNKTEDKFRQGNIKLLRNIPSRSILFNIIQIGESNGKNDDGMAVLRAFVRMFDRFCGYCEHLPYIAKLERDLDINGQYEAFKAAFREITGKDWTDARKQAVLQAVYIDKAYAKATGETGVSGIARQYSNDYKISVDIFVNDVKEWLDRQGNDKLRLNFFVDEVGQFIVRSTQHMTVLQTIAETLATVLPGRSFIFVTAQEDMSSFLGNLDNKSQTDDFSRIQARFGIRMKLGSKNVDEVIARRLLEKKDRHKTFLRQLYARTRMDFHTLFDFTDGSKTFPVYRDEDEFIEKYPFVPYQFDLFQSIIRSFSQQNAFEGRSSSVGERSMLGVFQKVLLSIKDTEIDENGTIAAFYRTYDGIQDTLVSAIQAALYQAEKLLGDDFTVSVLKSLFLVRFDQSFKASFTNIRILMQTSLEQNLTKLKEQLAASLERLEQESYIRRSGELYEYLTDEEKAIENEIRNVAVDDTDLGKEMNKVVFNDIIKVNAIRYQPSGKDYKFSKKVDDFQYTGSENLSINIITPYNDDNENTSILIGHNSGKKELLVVMKNDPVLERELKHYLQTDKYYSVTNRTGEQSTRAVILSKLRETNQKRKEELRARIHDDLREALWIVSGNIFQPQQGDPQQMVQAAFSRLIEQVYPNLALVVKYRFSSAMVPGILGRTRTLQEEIRPEEQDVLSKIGLMTMGDETVTLKTLMDYYQGNNYGWFEDDLQCVLASLLVKEKIDLKQNGSVVQGTKTLTDTLTSKKYYDAVTVSKQKSYTPQQIADLRNFYQDFFSYPSMAADGRSLAKDTAAKFLELHNSLNSWLGDSGLEVFHPQLRDADRVIRSVCGKTEDFYLTGMEDNTSLLLDLKNRILDDLQAFLNSGAQMAIYQGARSFIREEQDNLNSLGISEERTRIESILRDPQCYKGHGIQDLKQLQQKLQGLIDAMLIGKRDEAKRKIDKLEEEFKETNDYVDLTEDQKQSFAREYEAARQKIERLNRALTIGNELESFTDSQVDRLNSQIAMAVANRKQKTEPDPEKPGGGSKGGYIPPKPEPKPVYVSASDLKPRGQVTILDSEAEVNAYLEALREAYLNAVREGKKIRL